MKQEIVTVLILEKGKSSKRIIQNMLAEAGNNQISLIETKKITALSELLKKNPIQVILYDFEFQNDTNQFNKIKQNSGNLPLVALVNPECQARAITAIQAGAQDYLIQGNFDGNVFNHSIRAAIERQTVTASLETKLNEFQENEARFFNVIANNVDGIVVVDLSNIIRFVNPAAERFLAQKNTELLNTRFKYTVDINKSSEICLGQINNKNKIAEMRAVHTQWEGKAAYLVSLRDITERKYAEQKLKENEERFVLAIKGSQDGVWDWNFETGEIYYSTEWKQIIGHAKTVMTNSPDEWFNRVHPDDISQLRKQIDSHLKKRLSTIENEHRLLHQDGSYKWVVVRGTAVFKENRKPIRLSGSLRDITDRKEAEHGLKSALAELKFALASEKVLLEELDRKNKDLVELSITDGLTGLYNHRFIQERFDFEFKRAKRYKAVLTSMMIDIDHFKRINDSYGHQFGDMVLREISSIIKNNTREVDICGRYGGEEFLIITTQNSDGAIKHATKLLNAVQNHVFKNKNHSIHVTVSIGLADYKRDIVSKQEMLERSDMALYQAKESGRNCIRLWNEQSTKKSCSLDETGITHLKSKAITLSNQVRLSYMESTYALLKAVDAKDNYTLKHSENVSHYAVKIARAFNLNAEEIEVIKNAALLHDIGKIGIDSTILKKGKSLTELEFEALKKHPTIGVSILKDVKFLERELPLIQHHHEWYDGSGYPHGLFGREIPFGALIIAVADAYDAMSTNRYFKQKLSRSKIILELKRGSGIQFFPEIVNVFIKII